MPSRRNDAPLTSRARPLTTRRFRLLVRRHRRWLAAVCLACAAAVAVLTLAPKPPTTAAVVVAARDLASGAVPQAGDVVVRRWPVAALPDGLVGSPSAVLHRTLAGGLRRGEPVTDARLLGPGVLGGLPAGSVAVPVRLSDREVAALLNPGDVVDVYTVGGAPGTSGPVGDPAQPGLDLEGALGAASPGVRLVATAARVLGAPGRSAAGDGLIGGPLLQTDGGLLLVAAPDAGSARRLAATVGRQVTVALRPAT